MLSCFAKQSAIMDHMHHHFEIGSLVKNRDNFIFHYGVVVSDHQVFIFGCKSADDMSAVAWLEAIQNRKWQLAHSTSQFTPQEIVERCKTFARRLKIEPLKYNLFTNNCEHIARYLVEDQKTCTQISVLGVVQNFLNYGQR